MGVEYNKIHSTRKLEIKKKIDGEQIYLLFWKKKINVQQSLLTYSSHVHVFIQSLYMYASVL